MSETTVVRYRAEDFKKPAGNLTALKAMGLSVQSAVADALPSFLRKQAPAMLRALYTECQKQPALLNCTPESLFGACIQAAQMGLQLGGALGHAYLIPFKGRVTLVPGYKGYIQLVNRSGQAGVIDAFTVYDKDEFRVVYGTAPGIHHMPASYPTAEDVRKRKAVAYYATCRTGTGARFVVLTRAEAEVHRDRFALSQNGPWKDHFDAMALKTAIIKLCKYLPMSAELQAATACDERLEAGEPLDASFLFAGGEEADGPPPDKLDQLRGKLGPRTAEAEGRHVVLDLLGELSEAGGDPAVARFFEKHNVTEDDLANARGGNATKYANLLRAAVDEAKGGGE